MVSPPAPPYRTGWLWGVLALLLMIGTVASAFVVYGLTDLVGTGRWFPDAVEALLGAVVAGFALLLLTGMLYRVDRLRGTPHRTVRMFE